MKHITKISILFLLPIFVFGRELYIGYGESAKSSPEEAVKEAYNMLPEEVKKPDFCVIYLSIGYDSKRVIKTLRSLTGPKTKFYGETSCLGVATPNGMLKNGLAILAFKSKRMTFGVGICPVSKTTNGFSAGKKAIQMAIKDAGRKNEKPSIVLISPTPGIEEDVLKGIESVIGNDVPIIGGSAADNEINGKWKIFANHKVYSNGVSLAVIYTDLKIGYAFITGYKTTVKKGVATSAKGRTIYQIDNRPAGEVYNEWCSNAFSQQMKTGASILGPASFTPLAKRFVEKGTVSYITIHPSKISPEDKSLQVFAEVNTGDTLYLLKGNKSILLSRPASVGMAALYQGGIGPQDLDGGILIYCAGTMLAVKDELGNKGIPPLSTVLGGKPFIGVFTFGEQGFIRGIGSRHGNLMTSMIVFGE
ncbi:FIST C-terminal domain-containing protein [candidate division WOR-3 bacterium]|nr:FIST C-terminal domain-containing protein [candidate division WOR-3 bacterium]